MSKPLLPTHQGPQPAEPDPGYTRAEWAELLMRCTTHQLDAVRQAWKHQRPHALGALEQLLWHAPEDLLNDARNALERDKRWQDLPAGRRAAMLQLEAEEKQARRDNDATGSFLVSASLSDSGEFDLKLKRVAWRALLHWAVRAWKPAAIAVAGGVFHWLIAHWEEIRRLLR